jgi:hypothetical protein
MLMPDVFKFDQMRSCGIMTATFVRPLLCHTLPRRLGQMDLVFYSHPADFKASSITPVKHIAMVSHARPQAHPIFHWIGKLTLTMLPCTSLNNCIVQGIIIGDSQK